MITVLEKQNSEKQNEVIVICNQKNVIQQNSHANSDMKTAWIIILYQSSVKIFPLNNVTWKYKNNQRLAQSQNYIFLENS